MKRMNIEATSQGIEAMASLVARKLNTRPLLVLNAHASMQTAKLDNQPQSTNHTMKLQTKSLITALALLATAAGAYAQSEDAPRRRPGGEGRPDSAPAGEFRGRPDGPGGPQGFRGPGGERPRPPIIAALDADNDGVISEAELANATKALKTLDKNGDGKLTMDELMPPRPEGQRGPGGPGGGFEGGRRPGGAPREGNAPEGERPGRNRPPADQ